MNAFLNYIDWERLKRSMDLALLVLAAFALGTLILGHVLGVASWEMVEHALAWPLRLAVGLLVFLCAAAWLRVHRFSHRGNFAAFSVGLAAGHWIAMDLHHALGHGLHLSPIWILLIALVAFLVCRGFHHRARESWRNWVTFAREPATVRGGHQPVRHLVMFLSPPTTVPREEAGGCLSFFDEKGGWVSTSREFAQDIETIDKNGFHNWLQLLRGIQPHAGTLRSLWIVVSKPSVAGGVAAASAGNKPNNAHGSALYGELAKWWLEGYLPDCEIKVSSPHDFEDFKSMLEYVRHEVLGTLHPHSRQDLAIDITGGMKITSVLGAFLTANDQAVFQYVQTVGAGGKKPSAQIYDIRHDIGPEIPG